MMYLFYYDLFNDAVGNWNYVAQNDKLVNEW